MNVEAMARLHQRRQPRLHLDRRPLPRARRPARRRRSRSAATPASPATIRPRSPTATDGRQLRLAFARRQPLESASRMTDLEAIRRQARARHRRQPRHRRRDRRSARRRRRPRHPDRPHRPGARSRSRSASTPPAAAPRSPRSTSPTATPSPSWRRRSPSAGTALDILVLNAAMLGSLTPVEHIDPKELDGSFSSTCFANQALIAAFDPMLRRAEQGRRGRHHLLGRQRAARLLGRLWRIEGGVRHAARRLCRRNRPRRPLRVQIVDPGATRTRMRQLAFPGRGAGQPQAARSRRGSDPRAAAGTMRKRAAGCGSTPRPCTSVTCATSIPPPRKPPSQYIR